MLGMAAKTATARTRRQVVGVLAIAALAVIAVIALGRRDNWLGDEPALQSVQDQAIGDRAAVAGDPAATTPPVVDAASRVEATPPALAPAAPADAMRELHGRVFDSRGQPFAEVPLQLRGHDGVQELASAPAGTHIRSDGAGAFALQAPRDVGVTVLAGAGFVTLRTTPAAAGSTPEVQIVVALQRDLQGLVHDARGLPIAGARVDVPTFLLPEFPWQLEATLDPSMSAPKAVVSDAEGRFVLPRAPIAPGLFLACHRDGYRSARLQTTSLPANFVDIELGKDVATDGAVHGTVLDPTGRPLAHASMRYGFSQSGESAADGTFRFEFEKRPRQLLAMSRGLQPVVVDAVGPDTPMPLVLRFAAPCLAIRGHVRNERGEPVAGALVNLVDPERAGRDGSIEKLSAGTDESGLPQSARARTDDAGAFTITGLRERTYRLRAWDESTAASVQSEPIAAGSSDVTLVLDRGALVAELRGRVTTRDGAGIAGVTVGTHALVDTFDDVALVRGPKTTSGADGSFVLQRVPARHLRVTASTEEHEYAEVAIEQCLADKEVHLVLLRKCYVQVEGPAGLWISLLDADGKELMVTVQTVDSAFGGNGITLSEGNSAVMAVAESATTMVWRRENRELGRKAISLLPGRDRKNVLQVPR